MSKNAGYQLKTFTVLHVNLCVQPLSLWESQLSILTIELAQQNRSIKIAT